MKIATWNVNSLKARLPRVESWIAEHAPDVLVLQETKCADSAFPAIAFDALGYQSVHHGNGRWNGVVIISKVGLDDASAGFVGEDPRTLDECRSVQANCAGTRVISVYVPNGRTVDSEFYNNKLAWLHKLRIELDQVAKPEDDVVILGDFNVAPEDRDVWDIAQFVRWRSGALWTQCVTRTLMGSVLSRGGTIEMAHSIEDGECVSISRSQARRS